MSVKRKRVVVSLETKLEAIKCVDSGDTLKKVALKLGVGEVTVGDWLRNRRNIEEWCAQRFADKHHMKRKTMRKGDYEQTSEALFKWFTEMKQKGSPLTGPIIQAKALQLHKQCDDSDDMFSASVGWLERWKKRYGITLFTCPGSNRKQFVHLSCPTEEQHEGLSCVSLGKDTSQSCDVAVIKSEPSQGDYFEAEQDDSVSNIDNQEKKPINVAPGSENESESLSSNNTYQLHAWMDACLFKNYFDDLLESRRRERDGAHSSMSESAILSNSQEPKFKLMPSDNMPGVFSFQREINRTYRKLILKHILEDLDNDGSVFSSLERINGKGVIYWLRESWNEVKMLTPVESEGVIATNYDDIVFFQLAKDCGIPYPVTAEDIQHWMNDKETETHEMVTRSAGDGAKKEQHDESSCVEELTISHSEGLNAMETVLQYAVQQGDCSPQELKLLRKIKCRAEMKQLLQFEHLPLDLECYPSK